MSPDSEQATLRECGVNPRQERVPEGRVRGKFIFFLVCSLFLFFAMKKEKVNRKRKTRKSFQRRYAPRNQMEVVEGKAFNLIRCASYSRAINGTRLCGVVLLTQDDTAKPSHSARSRYRADAHAHLTCRGRLPNIHEVQ